MGQNWGHYPCITWLPGQNSDEFHQFCHGFAVYESHPHLVQSRLAYMCLIIREARRAGGDGWVSYDAVFRQNAAQDNTTEWSKLDASLHSSTFLSTRRTNTTFCSLCLESNHTSSRCALAPLMSEGGRSSPPLLTCTYHTNKEFHITDEAFHPSQPLPKVISSIPYLPILEQRKACESSSL